MTTILDGTKFDFRDVLIRPKRSLTTSRSAVDIQRSFLFYQSDRAWAGVSK